MIFLSRLRLRCFSRVKYKKTKKMASTLATIDDDEGEMRKKQRPKRRWKEHEKKT
jgi:hypothetical protein